MTFFNHMSHGRWSAGSRNHIASTYVLKLHLSKTRRVNSCLSNEDIYAHNPKTYIKKNKSELLFILRKGIESVVSSWRKCACACLLTSCERPPADGSRPLSLARLSLGELHPETGVLLLLGEESGHRSSYVNEYIHCRAQNKTHYWEWEKKLPYNSFHLI